MKLGIFLSLKWDFENIIMISGKYQFNVIVAHTGSRPINHPGSVSQIRDPEGQFKDLLSRRNLILPAPLAHLNDLVVDEGLPVFGHELGIEGLHTVPNHNSKHEDECIGCIRVIEKPLVVSEWVQRGAIDKLRH